jgi:peptidoglycan/LPS O-acetylase OafA/YrhL
MYLVLPFVFILLRHRPSLGVGLGLWVASVVVAMVQPDLVGRLDVARFGPCFMAGVVGYLGMRQTHARLPGWLWPLALVASAGVFVAGPRWITSWLFCLAVGLLAPHFQEITAPWLRRASAMVAKYSYGIYLSHTVVFWIAFRVFEGQTLAMQWVVCLVLAALTPMMSYHLLEEPCVQVGKRLAERWFHREVIRHPESGPIPSALVVVRSPASSTQGSSSARLLEIDPSPIPPST